MKGVFLTEKFSHTLLNYTFLTLYVLAMSVFNLFMGFFCVQMHHIKVNTGWKAGVVHQEDILSIAHLPPYLMATCSFDGEINIWNLDTENLFVKLRKGFTADM